MARTYRKGENTDGLLGRVGPALTFQKLSLNDRAVQRSAWTSSPSTCPHRPCTELDDESLWEFGLPDTGLPLRNTGLRNAAGYMGADVLLVMWTRFYSGTEVYILCAGGNAH